MNMIALLALEPIKGHILGYQKHLIQEISRLSDKVIVMHKHNILLQEKELFVQENVLFEKVETEIDVLKWRKYIVENTLEIKKYIKVLLVNDAIIGPLYDLKKVFTWSEEHEMDFWGITSNSRMLYGKGRVIEKFIHKHFFVINTEVLIQRKILRYIEKLSGVKDTRDAREQFEYAFTQILVDYGYKYKVFCETAEWENEDVRRYVSYLMFEPVKMLKELSCPILSLDLFHVSKDIELCYNIGEELNKVIKYIIDYTEYDIDLLYEYMFKTMDPYDIWQHLNNNFIFSMDKITDESQIKGRAVVVAHLYYEDLFEKSLTYLCNVPNEVDVIITCSDMEKISKLETMCAQYLKNKVEIVYVNARGREWSAMLLAVKPKLMKYDYLGFVHDKKSRQMFYSSVGEAFNEHIWENIIGSEAYVRNVLSKLEGEKHIGLMVPPIVYHGEFWGHSIDFWTVCFDGTKELAERLKLETMPNYTRPVLSIGSTFWARVSCLEKLLSEEFCLEDFPKEPMATDGTINHCIERILPYVVQDSNTYVGVIMTDKTASINETNMRSMMQRILWSARHSVEMDLVSAHSTVKSFDNKFVDRDNIVKRVLRKISKSR